MGQKDILYMSWDEFEDYCKEIVKKLKEKKVDFENIYGVPRGGLCLAVKLSHLTKKPLVVNYSDATEKTLIADDVSDSGKTFKKYKDHKTVALYMKPESSFEPTVYVGITDRWIIFPWEEK